MKNSPFTDEEHAALKKFAAYARKVASENYERLDNGNYRIIKEIRYPDHASQDFKSFCTSLRDVFAREKEEAAKKGKSFNSGPIAIALPRLFQSNSEKFESQLNSFFNVKSYSYLSGSSKSLVFESEEFDGRQVALRTAPPRDYVPPLSPYLIQPHEQHIKIAGVMTEVLPCVYLEDSDVPHADVVLKFLAKIHEGTGIRIEVEDLLKDEIGFLPDGTVVFPDKEVFQETGEPKMSMFEMGIHIDRLIQEWGISDALNPMSDSGEFKQHLLLPIIKQDNPKPEIIIT